MLDHDRMEELADSPDLAVDRAEWLRFRAHVAGCSSCMARLRDAEAFDHRYVEPIRRHWRHLTREQFRSLKLRSFDPNSGVHSNNDEWHLAICDECQRTYDRFIRTPRTSPVFAWRLAALAASIMVVGAIGWYTVHSGPPTAAVPHPNPDPTVEVAKTPESGEAIAAGEVPKKPPPILALALVPRSASRAGRGSYADRSADASLRLPKAKRRIRLELGLGDARTVDYSHYAVTVRTIDGHEIWRQSGRHGSSTPRAQSGAILVTLPSDLLHPAEYVVKLSGVAPTADLSYSFRVLQE